MKDRVDGPWTRFNFDILLCNNGLQSVCQQGSMTSRMTDESFFIDNLVQHLRNDEVTLVVLDSHSEILPQLSFALLLCLAPDRLCKYSIPFQVRGSVQW